MLKKTLIALLFLCNTIFAQTLDDMLKEAFENNLALKQKNIELTKSMEILKEARGMFLPDVEIDARYSRAGGGRLIEFPVGDLLNPIHTCLNQLMQQQLYPENLENVNIPFLREKEHETKVRIVQPIFNPPIYYNHKIKKYQFEIEKANRDAYKRELVFEVKKAYFNYLKSTSFMEILNDSKKLLEENLRVSNKLYENQKATQEIVFRAEAELSSLDQQLAEAEKYKDLSEAYLNFLLNNPLDQQITATETENKITPPPPFDDIVLHAMDHHEAITQFNAAIKASENGVKIQKSSFLPIISFAFDYGFQGEKYSFTDKDDYWMASAVMQWNLFNGFQDKAKINQAKLQKRELDLKKQQIKEQIKLQIKEAHKGIYVANKAILAAKAQENSARKSFEIVERKYNQGMAPQIEYMDAQTTFINAKMNVVVKNYEYSISLAELEKAAALYPIKD